MNHRPPQFDEEPKTGHALTHRDGRSPEPSPGLPSKPTAEWWVGLAFALGSFLFCGYLITRTLDGAPSYSPILRATFIAFLAFGAAGSFRFIGGDARARGKLKGLPQTIGPFSFEVAGGIAVFFLTLFAANWLLPPAPVPNQASLELAPVAIDCYRHDHNCLVDLTVRNSGTAPGVVTGVVLAVREVTDERILGPIPPATTYSLDLTGIDRKGSFSRKLSDPFSVAPNSTERFCILVEDTSLKGETFRSWAFDLSLETSEGPVGRAPLNLTLPWDKRYRGNTDPSDRQLDPSSCDKVRTLS